MDTATGNPVAFSGLATYNSTLDVWEKDGFTIKASGNDLILELDANNSITLQDFREDTDGDGDVDNDDDGGHHASDGFGLELADPTNDMAAGDGLAGDGDLNSAAPAYDTVDGSAGEPDIGEVNPIMEGALIAYQTANRSAVILGDPLVLDLDGDGLELINSNVSNAFFDIDDNGFAEQTGWASADEGFLVRDLNSNGTIDDVGEMFGNATQTGLVELATLDSNSDGVIDSADTDFGDLLLWRDLNEDGMTDGGELQTMAQAGLVSFELSPQSDGRTLEGNFINNVSHFTRSDNSTDDLAEVFFRTDEFNTQFVGDGGTDAAIDPSTLSLPQSRGYGNLPSLQVAMTQDAAFKASVESFIANVDLNDYASQNSVIEELLFDWAGLPVTVTSPITNFDGHQLAFLEAFTGESFVQTGGVPTNFLNSAWNSVMGEFSARLLVQGPLQTIFPNASYDFATDKLSLNDTLPTILTNISGTAVESNIAFLSDLRTILLSDQEGLGVTEGVIKAEVNTLFSAAIIALGESGDYGLSALLAAHESENSVDAGEPDPNDPNGYITGTFRNDTFIDLEIQSDFGDHIHGGDLIIAKSGNDNLTGGAGNDIIMGGEGNDSLISNGSGVIADGADYFSGGAGNDTIFVYGSNDTVDGGSGNDQIFMDSNSPTTPLSDALIYAGAGDDYFRLYVNSSSILGGDGDDVFGTVNDQISAYESTFIDLGEGNDSAYLFLGASTINGGAGDDTLSVKIVHDGDVLGGDGNDTIDLLSYLGPIAGVTPFVSGGAGDDVITGKSGGIEYGADT